MEMLGAETCGVLCQLVSCEVGQINMSYHKLPEEPALNLVFLKINCTTLKYYNVLVFCIGTP
jgi:hypothetical protein